MNAFERIRQLAIGPDTEWNGDEFALIYAQLAAIIRAAQQVVLMGSQGADMQAAQSHQDLADALANAGHQPAT